MTDYTSKIIAITGAANGMGRELAGRLGAAGAKLALADIDREHEDAFGHRLRAHVEPAARAVAESELDLAVCGRTLFHAATQEREHR